MQAPSTRPFCWYPFKNLEIKATSAGLCCWLKPVGDFRTQSIEEVWNGQAAQEVRRSILDGSFRYCKTTTCPHLMTIHGPVAPVGSIDDPDLRLAIDRGLTILPYGPRTVQCHHDRSCNLSCPSCRTKVIVESDREEEILFLQQKIEREALFDAHFLEITGTGDPFGSPYLRDWLRGFSLDRTPNLQGIRLYTNGLLWTPEMWRTFPEPVRALIVSAHVSIDAATAATYAVNRRGGDFSRLLENLAFISRLRREGPLHHLKINFVVQANNFREMPAFVELGLRFGVDRVFFQELENLGAFDDKGFERRAVHRFRHPEHDEFLRVLGDPALTHPLVFMGNMAFLQKCRS